MVDICRNPSGQWFACKASFPTTTQECLVSFDNTTGYIAITINKLELCDFLAQLALFCLQMTPLAHILT